MTTGTNIPWPWHKLPLDEIVAKTKEALAQLPEGKKAICVQQEHWITAAVAANRKLREAAFACGAETVILLLKPTAYVAGESIPISASEWRGWNTSQMFATWQHEFRNSAAKECIVSFHEWAGKFPTIEAAQEAFHAAAWSLDPFAETVLKKEDRILYHAATLAGCIGDGHRFQMPALVEGVASIPRLYAEYWTPYPWQKLIPAFQWCRQHGGRRILEYGQGPDTVGDPYALATLSRTLDPEITIIWQAEQNGAVHPPSYTAAIETYKKASELTLEQLIEANN